MAPEKGSVPPELRRLLDLEAARPDPPEELKDQLRSAMAVELGRRRLRRPSLRARLGTLKTLAVVGGIAAAGGLIWKLSHPGSTAPSVQAEPQPSSPPPPIPSPVPAPAPEVAPAAPAPLPSVPRRKLARPAPGPASFEESLGRERTLIDQARAQLRGGHASGALATLRLHQRQFPDGILVEERLGLQVEALAADGDLAVAKQRAQAFRARFPQSPLQPAIEAALRRGAP